VKTNLLKTRSLLVVLITQACIFSPPISCLAAEEVPAANKQEPKTWRIDSTKIVDLTHELAAGIPDFHEGNDGFEYRSVYTVKKDGYANGYFSTPEHYGTHIDAPSHFIDGGASIDQLSAKDLIVPLVVIDVREEVSKDPDYCLTVKKIRSFEEAGKIPDHSAVLLLTGWSKRWSNPVDYRNTDSSGTMHYPAFSKESADFLVNERGVAYLGIDTLSLDPGISHDYPVHKLTLAKGIHLIENLDSLSELPARGALLFCGPLRIKGGTGSPARVVALLP
jgi:kynurenine formamidase